MSKPYVRLVAEQAPRAEGLAGTLSTDVFWFPAQQMKLDPNPKLESRRDEMRGILGDIQDLVSQYDPDWEIKYRGYPDLLGFHLFMLFGQVTTTAGNGIITDPDTVAIPTGAYKHEFTFKDNDIPQTFTAHAADHASNGPFFIGTGLGVESLHLAGDKESLSIQAKGKGLYVANISDPSYTPTEPALSKFPWSARQLVLTWLGGGAIAEKFDIELAQALDWAHGFTVNSKYPTEVELGNDYRTCKGSIDKRKLDIDDWNAAMNADTFAALAKYNSGSHYITGAYPYKMWVDMPKCQYTSLDPAALENKPRREAKYKWAAKHDSVSGYEVKVTLVNAVAGYKTGI